MESTTHWRRVWRTFAKYRDHVEEQQLTSIVTLTRKQLEVGILMYKPYESDDYVKSIEKLEFANKEFQEFFHQISVTLNLQAEQAWGVFCNYLMFDYYGKLENVEQIVCSKSLAKDFLANLWRFYTSEREFLLRVVRFLVEGIEEIDSSDEFRSEFSLASLRESLIDQFNYLIREKPVQALHECVPVQEWVNRNLIEQQELLLIYATSAFFEDITGDELLRVLEVFMLHVFGTTFCDENVKQYGNKETLNNIKHLETILFLCPMDLWWDSPREWQSYANDLGHLINIHEGAFNNEQYIILLLAWATLNLRLPDGDRSFESHMIFVLEHNVFGYMKKVISNDMFKNNLLDYIAKRAIFNLLRASSECFTGPCFHLIYTEAADLLCEFLPDNDYFEQIVNHPGLKTILDMVFNMFPFNFCPLTQIASTLTDVADKTDLILDQVCHLEKITLEYRNYSNERGQIKLPGDMRPFGDNLIFIKANSVAFIQTLDDKDVITIDKKYSYFTVFRCIVRDAMLYLRESVEPPPPVQESLCAGFEFLVKLLNRPAFVMANEDIVQSFRLAHLLLQAMLRDEHRHMSLALRMMFLRTCLSLCKFQICNPSLEIVHLSFLLEHLPNIPIAINQSEELYVQSIDHGASDTYPLEKYGGKNCLLLLDYVNLVIYTIENNIFYKAIQEPGTIYLLSTIFPLYIKRMVGPDPNQAVICYSLIKIVHILLNKECVEKERTDLDNWLLGNLFQGLFLLENIFNVFGIGNVKLTLEMCRFPYWERTGAERAQLLLNTVRRSISVAHTIMRYIMTAEGATSQVAALKIFYPWSGDQISVLKVICGYINHVIDSKLPIIACKCLQLFVSATRLPIHKSLELDEYQMQSMFLDKLKDPMEAIDLKLSIIYFVSLCVEQQYSAGPSFGEKDDMGSTPENTIATFLFDYMHGTGEAAYFNAEEESAVVDLLYKLWITRKQMIVNILRENTTFWHDLTAPLLNIPEDFDLAKVIQILEIVTLEVYNEAEILPQGVTEFLNTIFEESEMMLDKWDIFLEAANATEEHRFHFLAAFRRFLLVVLNRCPVYYESCCFFDKIERFCWMKLIDNLYAVDRLRYFEGWMQLFFRLIHALPDKFATSIEMDLTATLVGFADQFVTKLVVLYDFVAIECRRLVLAFLTLLANHLKTLNSEQPIETMSFLIPFGYIFDKEYQDYLTLDSYTVKNADNFLSAVLILNNFIDYSDDHDFLSYFQDIEYVRKLTIFGLSSLQLPHLLESSIYITNCLHKCSYTRLIEGFRTLTFEQYYKMSMPLGKFYLQDDSLLYGEIPRPTIIIWEVFAKWCYINMNLLHDQGRRGMALVLLFLKSYTTLVIDVYLSIQKVVHKANIKAAIACTRLLCAFGKHKNYWWSNNATMTIDIIDCMRTSLGMSMKIILWPVILSFVETNSTPEELMKQTEQSKYPEQELLLYHYADLVNLLYESVGVHCRCLSIYEDIHFSDLNNFFMPVVKKSLVYDFRVPHIHDNEKILTFGLFLNFGNHLLKNLNDVLKLDETVIGNPSPPTFHVVVDHPSTMNRSILTKGLARYNVLDGNMRQSHLKKLTESNLMNAMESVYSYMSIYIMYAIRDTNVSQHFAKTIRQDLSYELSNFCGFVHKRIDRLYSNTPLPVHVKYGLNTRVFTKTVFDERITDRRDLYLNAMCYWYLNVCSLVYYSHIDEFVMRKKAIAEKKKRRQSGSKYFK